MPRADRKILLQDGSAYGSAVVEVLCSPEKVNRHLAGVGFSEVVAHVGLGMLDRSGTNGIPDCNGPVRRLVSKKAPGCHAPSGFTYPFLRHGQTQVQSRG